MISQDTDPPSDIKIDWQSNTRQVQIYRTSYTYIFWTLSLYRSQTQMRIVPLYKRLSIFQTTTHIIKNFTYSIILSLYRHTMQEQIILSLNTWMASSTFFSNIIPILSDIFVFSYPIYLVYLYFVAHDHQQRRKKIFLKTQQLQHKYDALLIFFSFVGSVVVNYIFATCDTPFT